MSSFAVFRLPRKTEYTLMVQMAGEPLELGSACGLDGRSGFVIAPFSISCRTPLLLLQPDIVATYPSGSEIKGDILECIHDADMENRKDCIGLHPGPEGRKAYSVDFGKFHSRLAYGEFHKIVLARCLREDAGCNDDPIEMFHRACRMYPRMFVALFSTPQSGTWLMATPEILLEGGHGRWSTIALAGTMKLEGTSLEHFDMPMKSRAGRMEQDTQLTWNDKNIEEQRFVSTYIKDCLIRFSQDVAEDGPYTVRAGNLVHLRSDFSFTLKDDSHIGELIDALHPTPAVCGLPKKGTFDFILGNEHTPRTWYSGFTGPLGIDGSTNLYVSLRCMRLCRDGYDLYAGGGLLKGSVEQQEWEETESKMDTMGGILQ